VTLKNAGGARKAILEETWATIRSLKIFSRRST